MPHATEWLLPLMATVVFYGLAQALTKKLMSALPAGAFIVLYVGVKAVLGLGLYLGFASPQDSAQTARAFLFLSLFGNVINSLAWLFYFQAMERGAASIVGTITAAYPVVTVILAWAFLGEQLSRFQAVGVILVIAAGLLLAYEKDEPGRAPLERRSLVLAGTVFILWGVASAVYKAAFSAPFASTLRFLFHNAVVFSLLLFPYGLRLMRGRSWGARRMLLLGLVPVCLFCAGDLALFRAIELGPASIVTPLSGMYPIVTLLYAWPVLKERVTARQGLAVALSLLSILLMSLG